LLSLLVSTSFNYSVIVLNRYICIDSLYEFIIYSKSEEGKAFVHANCVLQNFEFKKNHILDVSVAMEVL
jgi:hypothetical protein